MNREGEAGIAAPDSEVDSWLRAPTPWLIAVAFCVVGAVIWMTPFAENRERQESRSAVLACDARASGFSGDAFAAEATVCRRLRRTHEQRWGAMI